MIQHSFKMISKILQSPSAIIRAMSKDPLKYNFTNFTSVMEDIDRRSYFFKKTSILIQKKAEIDINYANSIENVLIKEFVKNTNTRLASQALYQKLVVTMLEQPKRIREMAEELIKQSEKMNQYFETENNKQKKLLEEAQRISKELTNFKQKLEKIRPKLQRKSSQLQQIKVQYLSSLLSNDQLQRKNDLYLQVGKMEHSVKPIQEQYRHFYSKYNESISAMTSKFNTHLQTIEEIQLLKIKKIKEAASKYVFLTKVNLDSFLQHYPFLREAIDSIRQKDDFVAHSRQSLIVEGYLLQSFTIKESNYVDAIFERIERKKNLEEIILYGQNIQHKKHLNSTILNQPIIPPSNLSPKTIRMIEIFREVFEGESTQDMLNEIEQLFKDDEKLRKDFILCLQKYRISNQFELRESNRQYIKFCLQSFLDVCAQELDTYNSKMLMILSLTYHFKVGETKVQLQELISNHYIWTNIGWWQAALLESIYEQTRVKVKKQECPISIWDIKAGGISRKQQGQEETHQHICFNQLLYYVSNMNLFHLDPDKIIQYAKLNIQLLKFTGKLAKDILDLCPKSSSSPIMSKKLIESPNRKEN